MWGEFLAALLHAIFQGAAQHGHGLTDDKCGISHRVRHILGYIWDIFGMSARYISAYVFGMSMLLVFPEDHEVLQDSASSEPQTRKLKRPSTPYLQRRVSQKNHKKIWLFPRQNRSSGHPKNQEISAIHLSEYRVLQ